MEGSPWGFRMGIYEDWQIHTKTCFQTIKSQDSQFALHTDRTSSNEKNYVNSIILHKQQNHRPAQYTNLQRNLQSNMLMEFTYVYYTQGTYRQNSNKGITQNYADMVRVEIQYVEICM